MRTNGSQGPIDIVTTALRRVDILKMTYDSFLLGGVKNLPEYRLIVNVDPLGSDDPKEIEKLLRSYTKNYVINISESPNFSNAVKWCLQKVESNHYLHIEDDWVLKKQIDFEKWKGCLELNELSQCALAEGDYREVIRSCTFRPHLAKRECAFIYKVLDGKKDPEKAAQAEYHLNNYSSMDYPNSRMIVGTGRKWAKHNGLRKRQHPSEGGGVVDDWFSYRATGFLVGMEYWLYKRRLQKIIEKISL